MKCPFSGPTPISCGFYCRPNGSTSIGELYMHIDCLVPFGWLVGAFDRIVELIIGIEIGPEICCTPLVLFSYPNIPIIKIACVVTNNQ